MRASLFLIINAIILTYLVLRLFLSSKSKSRPQVKTEHEPLKQEFFDIFTGGHVKPRERSLNCHFQFQGKTYDAYQVLGIPAGAPMQVCQDAYEKLKENKSQADLYAQAINALKMK